MNRRRRAAIMREDMRTAAVALLVLVPLRSPMADDPCGNLKLSQAGSSYTIVENGSQPGFSAILKSGIECTGCAVVSGPPPRRANWIECSGRKEP
jgi:hypothetical protein